MEPQNNIIEPTNKNHRILILTISILLTAAVIGGGTYYFLNQQIKKQNELITELEKNNKKIEEKKEVARTEEKSQEDPRAKAELANLEKKSRSSVEIDLSETEKAKVFLLANNESVTKVAQNEIFCGAPKAGANRYSGNYQLILDDYTFKSTASKKNYLKDSTLTIGEYEFVENTPTDGTLAVQSFNSTNLKKFIILDEYGSCSTEEIKVFGLDSNNIIKQFNFKFKNGQTNEKLLVTGGITKSSKGNLIRKVYTNATGKYYNTEFQFDDKELVFKEVGSFESDN